MRELTHREKRTVRIGAAAVAVYLLVLGGAEVRKFFERKHSQYTQLVREAKDMRNEIKLYGDKAAAAQKLMDAFKLDPAKLTRATVVGEASSAIQKAAAGGGIGVGPVRESPARAANKELATVQFEGTGPVPAVTAFLARLETIGYPLVIESVQLTPVPMGPAMVKMSITIVILDFDQWNKPAAPNKSAGASPASSSLEFARKMEAPNA